MLEHGRSDALADVLKIPKSVEPAVSMGRSTKLVTVTDVPTMPHNEVSV